MFVKKSVVVCLLYESVENEITGFHTPRSKTLECVAFVLWLADALEERTKEKERSTAA
jgi:hypothetical protein